MTPEVVHLYRSPGHNFVGRHGQSPGTLPMEEVGSLECLARRGVVGDRYFDQGPDSKGQITFFSWEAHEELCRQLKTPRGSPARYRRNVITRGVDLNAWIGVEFEVQGVRFAGTEESRPCYWMNLACGPGAEELLRGRGGLRARILTSGLLHRQIIL